MGKLLAITQHALPFSTRALISHFNGVANYMAKQKFKARRILAVLKKNCPVTCKA